MLRFRIPYSLLLSLNTLLPLVSLGQANEKSAYEFLSRAESVESLSSGDFQIHNILTTSLFVDFDGQRVVDFQQTILSATDTLPKWFFDLEPGEIYTERTDTSVSLVRSFGYDSVLCIRAASRVLPSWYSAGKVDSLVKMIQESVHNNEEWNRAPIHPSCPDPGKKEEVRGDMHWMETGQLTTELQRAILNHQVGEVFSFTTTDTDGRTYSVILYKSHPDTWFKRNIIAGIYLPVH